MTTYVIGDVQGCFTALQDLLKKIEFDAQRDMLWFVGDLVNRGPDSLAVLRFVKGLGNRHVVTLGNHDLNLLAVHYGIRELRESDTLTDILAAPDREELMTWLRYCPLIHIDEARRLMMVHAGVAPQWTREETKRLAKEVETALRDNPSSYLSQMYGDEPAKWDENLRGYDRLRCITNYLTRIRFCDEEGRLDLHLKGTISNPPPNYMPWFVVPGRRTANDDIIFGHWAALNGVTDTPHTYALDTGCVWGKCLTALRLEDKARIQIACDEGTREIGNS